MVSDRVAGLSLPMVDGRTRCWQLRSTHSIAQRLTRRTRFLSIRRLRHEGPFLSLLVLDGACYGHGSVGPVVALGDASGVGATGRVSGGYVLDRPAGRIGGGVVVGGHLLKDLRAGQLGLELRGQRPIRDLQAPRRLVLSGSVSASAAQNDAEAPLQASSLFEVSVGVGLDHPEDPFDVLGLVLTAGTIGVSGTGGVDRVWVFGLSLEATFDPKLLLPGG